MLDNQWVRLANNWLHDVATGLWAACLLVLWVLSRYQDRLAQESLTAWSAFGDAGMTVFWLLVGALVAITLTGTFRLFYWRAQTPADEMAAKRPALIGKHVVFLVIYAPGTWLAWSLASSWVR